MHADLGDVRLGHGFEPDGLPNACDARVVDATGLVDLLATRLITRIRGIPHAHNHLLGLSRIQDSCDVAREGVIAAAVCSNLDTIDPHAGIPVDRTEVQQCALIAPLCGHSELAPVPDSLVLATDAGQLRLHRERHQDVLRQLATDGRRFVLHSRLELPHPVESAPTLAHQLRTRMLRQRSVWI